MSRELSDLDASTSVADWLPLISRRIVDVLLACDSLADAVRNGAGDRYVDVLRHRVYELVARLDEVAVGGVREGLDPVYRREFDRVLARAEAAR